MVYVTDDFNRVDASTLGADWANAEGTDFGIVSQLAKTSSGSISVARNVNDCGDSDHVVVVDITNPAGTYNGVMCRMNDDEDEGYMFIVRNSTGDTRIQKFGGYGVYTALGASETITVPGQAYTMKVEVIGNEIKGYINDVEVISRTDSSYTTGQQGGLITWSSTQIFDDFSIAPYGASAPVSFAILSPASNQVVQRNNQNQADIVVSGTYTGTPDEIEYSYNGSAWSTLDAAPSDGLFSGTIPSVAGGTQADLQVRFKNDTSQTAISTNVGVGIVIGAIGQSNMVGLASTLNSYSHATLKASMYVGERWEDLVDPTFDFDEPQGNGCVLPLLASLIMADQGVPVAFVGHAEGTTSLVSGSANWAAPSGSHYTEFISRVNSSNVNAFEAILFHQGETDASNGTSETDYNNALDNLASAIDSNLSFIDGTKFIVAQIGQRTQADDANVDKIRKAQSDAWDDNSLIYAGPVLYDVIHTDGVHFKTVSSMELLRDRWWAAIDEVCFDGSAGRGPKLTGISQDQAVLTLTFDKSIFDSSQNYSPTAFRVTDDNVEVTISSAVRTNSTSIDLTLASVPTGEVRVSFALGSGVAALDVPNGVDSNSLPAEPFYSIVVDGSGGGTVPPNNHTTKGAVVDMIEPISSEGIITLIQGDDYLDVDGRALLWTGKNEDQWPDLSDATITLTAIKNTETFTKQGVVISATGTQSVRVELAASETEVSSGWWDYDVQATLSNGDVVTMVIGRLRVIQDYS